MERFRDELFGGVGLARTRDEHDWQPRELLFDRGGQRQAVHHRHVHVGNDDMDLVCGAQRSQRLDALRCLDNAITSATEHGGHQTPDPWFVIYYKTDMLRQKSSPIGILPEVERVSKRLYAGCSRMKTLPTRLD